MAIDIQAPRIKSEEKPREVIWAVFKSVVGELPINGGWGYSKEDAVIIDKDDPVVSKNIPFDGIGIEYIFVEMRIYAELIIFQSGDDKYAGIKWNFLKQILTNYEERYYDILFFEVTAIPFLDWAILKKEWDSNDGFQGSEAELKSYIDKKNSKTIRYTTEYWFDISSFYGKY